MDERQLWRTGSFVCEVRLIPDVPFLAVLCILKDNEPVVEVPVLSTIEMEERAHELARWSSDSTVAITPQSNL